MRESTRFLVFVLPICIAIAVAAAATDVWLGKPWTCAWLGCLSVGLFLRIRSLDFK